MLEDNAERMLLDNIEKLELVLLDEDDVDMILERDAVAAAKELLATVDIEEAVEVKLDIASLALETNDEADV
jgi:hypothetical protein